MNEKELLLTAEGIADLEEKLDNLKTVKRYEISEQIKQARAFGDISENAEYDEAKNEQAKIEGEIVQIESILRKAIVIDGGNIKTNVISVGNTVKILDLEMDEEETYTIVGSTEANPNTGKISNESPVGAALIGKKKNQIVEVETPGGVLQFKIINISK